MPNCAPTKKQVTNAIISNFTYAIPVTSMSALCARRSATAAIMDMIWNILVLFQMMSMSMEPIVNVERKEMNQRQMQTL